VILLDSPVLKGLFIVIDGIDFCGKGTQVDFLVSYLKNHPLDEKFKLISVVSTREPFNTGYSLEIRKVLQSTSDPYSKAEKLSELFVEDRKVHLRNLVEPCLSAGAFVVSDRYMYSTLAYQQAQGIAFDKLLRMHSGLRVPDIVFIIDISGKESLRRKALRLDKRPDEMFDRLEFQEKLSQNYRELKGKLPDHPIFVIDGLRSKDDIAKDIQEKVDSLVEKVYPVL